MIKHYFRTLKDEKFKVVDNIRTGVWTHVVAPTEAEITTLIETFALNEAVIEDAQDFFEVPRFVYDNEVVYCFTRYPFVEKTEYIDTAPILIIIGKSYVVTIAQRDVPFLKSFFTSVDIAGEPVYTTQKAKLFIQLMTALTKAYEHDLVKIHKSVHRERTRIRNIGTQEIERLVAYENELNDTISALVPTNAWLKQITTGNYLQLYNEDMALMKDLMVDNSQLINSTNSLLRSIQNVRSASEAIVTQNLNLTVKMLTVITILLTIPTVIASLYGMNVTIPLGDYQHTFWLVLALIGTVLGLVTYAFVKNKWL